jgi:hypothetical protein
MLWEAQLRSLAERRRQLVRQCDQHRAAIGQEAGELRRSLGWLGVVDRGWAKAGPWVWVAAPVAGVFLGARLARVKGWLGWVSALARGWRLLASRRAVIPPS